jgi:hypothetical protein
MIVTHRMDRFRAERRDGMQDRKLKHIRTRPYRPKANGKETTSRRPRADGGSPLDIQTALREWACAQAYDSFGPAKSLPAAMDPHVQLALPARQPKLKTANQPT